MDEYVILRKARAPQADRGIGAVKGLGRRADEAPRIELSVEQLDDAQAAEAARSDEVDALAPKMPIALIRPTASNQADEDEAWGLEAVGARRSGFTGRGMTIAVLDTGIDSTHPAFRGLNIRECDFTVAGTSNSAPDGHGHGTHCAGTIFGQDQGGKAIGVAPGISRALIGKVLDDGGEGSSTSIFDGLEWAIREGADIISMSLGFDFPGRVANLIDKGHSPQLATSQALVDFRLNLDLFRSIVERANTNLAIGKAPLIVAASGNESDRAGMPSIRIAASLPSSVSHLSVGAVERDGTAYRIANFSNSNPTLSAPGVGVISAQAGGGYVAMDGTSMACPHVAGVAALWAEKLASQRQEVSSSSLKSFLVANSSRSDLQGDTADVGMGLVQAPR